MSGVLHQATCVAIGGRGVLIEGLPGAGKSSLALMLIDRGAVLVGDDGVLLERRDEALFANPPAAIAGKLEVRGLGLIDLPVAQNVPVALVIRLDGDAERFREEAETVIRGGHPLPAIALWPSAPALPLRAEAALRIYGLP